MAVVKVALGDGEPYEGNSKAHLSSRRAQKNRRGDKAPAQGKVVAQVGSVQILGPRYSKHTLGPLRLKKEVCARLRHHRGGVKTSCA